MNLRPRRQQITETVEWDGIRFHLSVGFDDDGRAGEIFVAPVKSNRSLGLSMQDNALALSHLLQDDYSLDELGLMFTPLPDAASIDTPSLMGFLLRRAALIEADDPGRIGTIVPPKSAVALKALAVMA